MPLALLVAVPSVVPSAFFTVTVAPESGVPSAARIRPETISPFLSGKML